MKLSIYLNVLCVMLLFIEVKGQRKCRAKKGKYFKNEEPGSSRCGSCILCPPGQEWDVNATIRTSPNHGDLECYPCRACKENFYKAIDTLQNCSPCLLKCEKLHRYLEVPCGGVKRGHCGSCQPGYEDTWLNTEQPCTRLEGIYSSSTSDLVFKATSFPSSTMPWRTQENNRLTSDDKDFAFFGLCVVVVGLIGMICAYCIWRCVKTGRSRCQDQGTPVDGQNVSSTAVLVPNQRYDSDDVTSRLTKRLVYETDGPANDDVRGEIQWNPDEIQHEFPSVCLTKDDRVLTLTAKHVYGEATENLCCLLKVDRQTFFSERELWTIGRQGYKDFVLNILLTWIERAGKDATVNVLCKALYNAGCHDALREVEIELRNRGYNV